MKVKEPFDIRVPSELLFAPLPHWVKVVWMAIKSFQGKGKFCKASRSKITERVVLQNGRNMSVRQVKKGVEILIQERFLERNENGKLICLRSEHHSPEGVNTIPEKVNTIHQEGEHHSEKGEYHSPPSEKETEKEHLKPKEKKRESPIDYDSIFDGWNELARELKLPLVQSRTASRKKKIKLLGPRLLPNLEQAYQNIRLGTRWFLDELRPGFDWVWNETNFTKIIEGNYVEKTRAVRHGDTLVNSNQVDRSGTSENEAGNGISRRSLINHDYQSTSRQISEHDQPFTDTSTLF